MCVFVIHTIDRIDITLTSDSFALNVHFIPPLQRNGDNSQCDREIANRIRSSNEMNVNIFANDKKNTHTFTPFS